MGAPGAAVSQRLLHRGVGEPFAVDGDGVALLGDVAALREERLGALSLASTVSVCRAAAAGELFQRVDQHRGDALPGRARMHEQHVDMVGALQRGKADRRVLQRGDQRQLAGEPLAELAPRRRRPLAQASLLRFAVVVAGQFLDRGDEDRRQHGHIRRQIRPQPGLGKACPIATSPDISASSLQRPARRPRRRSAAASSITM